MSGKTINAPDGPAASGGYSQAFLSTNPTRILHVSGQIPVAGDGTAPGDFGAQARLAWRNVERQLIAAGMGLGNIVKHTTFLADRKYRAENSKVRQSVLGDHAPALTVIIADLYDEAWLLEIEAIAIA